MPESSGATPAAPAAPAAPVVLQAPMTANGGLKHLYIIATIIAAALGLGPTVAAQAAQPVQPVAATAAATATAIAHEQRLTRLETRLGIELKGIKEALGKLDKKLDKLDDD